MSNNEGSRYTLEKKTPAGVKGKQVAKEALSTVSEFLASAATTISSAILTPDRNFLFDKGSSGKAESSLTRNSISFDSSEQSFASQTQLSQVKGKFKTDSGKRILSAPLPFPRDARSFPSPVGDVIQSDEEQIFCTDSLHKKRPGAVDEQNSCDGNKVAALLSSELQHERKSEEAFYSTWSSLENSLSNSNSTHVLKSAKYKIEPLAHTHEKWSTPRIMTQGACGQLDDRVWNSFVSNYVEDVWGYLEYSGFEIREGSREGALERLRAILAHLRGL